MNTELALQYIQDAFHEHKKHSSDQSHDFTLGVISGLLTAYLSCQLITLEQHQDFVVRMYPDVA